MCHWLQIQLLSWSTRYFSTNDLTRLILFVVTAVLLCPVQVIATGSTVGTTRTGTVKNQKTAKKEDHSKTEKTTESKDSQPRPKQTALAALAALLRAVGRFYTLFSPVTALWAVSTAISKEGALRLSRFFALAPYARNFALLHTLSSSSVLLVIAEAAAVLALYVLLWTLLALPATIGMRRMHASCSILDEFDPQQFIPIDEHIRNKTDLADRRSLGFAQAWGSFGRRAYRKLLVKYAASFFTLLVAAAMGMYILMHMLETLYGTLRVDGRTFPEGYEGCWKSLGMHLMNAFRWSS